MIVKTWLRLTKRLLWFASRTAWRWSLSSVRVTRSGNDRRSQTPLSEYTPTIVRYLASVLIVDRHLIWRRQPSPPKRGQHGHGTREEPAEREAHPAAPAGVTGGTRPAWQRADVLVSVACGGLLGSVARYEVGQLLPTPEHGFPWSTLIVNVSGALLLGALLVLLLERFPPTRYARAFIGTGFLGAYTTFSAYMVETVLLAEEGYVGRATAYLLGTLAVGLFASWLGIVMGRGISALGRVGDDLEPGR